MSGVVKGGAGRNESRAEWRDDKAGEGRNGSAGVWKTRVSSRGRRGRFGVGGIDGKGGGGDRKTDLFGSWMLAGRDGLRASGIAEGV